MTLLLRPPFPPELAPRYIVACALGVCRALRACGATRASSGPTTYSQTAGSSAASFEADASGFVAAGIGVNVNQRDFPADIAGTAGSLLTATGRAHDPNDVIARILAECEPLFAACGDEAGYAALLESYQALSLTIGRRVRIFAPGEEYDAKAVGLDPLGMLIVQRDGGETRVVGAGDVTIRGAIGN